MINLDNKPELNNRLFFGDNSVARLDLSYDPQFKKLAETDEAPPLQIPVRRRQEERL